MIELKTIDLATVAKTVAALSNDKCILILTRVIEQHQAGIECLAISEVAELTGLSPQLAQHHVSNLVKLELLEARNAGSKTLVKIADFDTWGDLRIAFHNIGLILERRHSRIIQTTPINDGI